MNPVVDHDPAPKLGSKQEESVVARVYLVRHGETQENRDGIVQGQKDTKLNAQGEAQARLLASNAIRELKITRMMSSDLSRALSTAEAILEYHPDVALLIQPELRERAMGKLEGTRGVHRMAKALQMDPLAETTSVFAQRAVGWWNMQIVEWCRGRKQNKGDEPAAIVATTHGGFINSLVQTLVGSRKVAVGDGVEIGRCYNASVTMIEVLGNGKGVIRVFGSIKHLAEGEGETLGSNADVDGST